MASYTVLGTPYLVAGSKQHWSVLFCETRNPATAQTFKSKRAAVEWAHKQNAPEQPLRDWVTLRDGTVIQVSTAPAMGVWGAWETCLFFPTDDGEDSLVVGTYTTQGRETIESQHKRWLDPSNIMDAIDDYLIKIGE